MVIDAQQGWTREDSDIFTALWGDGPGTRGCKVQGLAMLVANKCDLLPQAGETLTGTLGPSVLTVRASRRVPGSSPTVSPVSFSDDRFLGGGQYVVTITAFPLV